MLGRKQEFNIKINELLDSFLLAIAGLISHALRDAGSRVPWLSWDPIESVDRFIWVMAIVVPFTPVLLELHGYYKHPSQKTIIKSLQQMVKASLWIALALGCLTIFSSPNSQYKTVARGFLPIYAIVGALFLLAKEAVLRSH